jgi:hypothetical protein
MLIYGLVMSVVTSHSRLTRRPIRAVQRMGRTVQLMRDFKIVRY